MNEDIVPQSNVPEFSVSDLAFSLKRTLEDTFSHVRVRGELSRVMIAGSGHMYSSLKDDQAVIDAVCWKGTLSKLSVRPEEGLEVICTGRISSYPKSSKYQLIIESMELAGEGALLKMLEERRKKLAAEGLFDQARKKPLPFLPETIGVVTSPTGAVIRDILHRLSDRFPRHVLVWPVLVQGEGAASQITAAIEGFDRADGRAFPRPDLVIVARGGGSLEDLMAFNEENVVRAAANCSIPLISAVGHETDTTLIDYAADLRAPTPTGAAEMAVPVRTELLAQVLDDGRRLLAASNRLLTENTHRLEARSSKLGDPSKLLNIKTQNLDYLSGNLVRGFRNFVTARTSRLSELSAKIRRPEERLLDAQKSLNRWSEQLAASGPKITKEPGVRLNHLGKMLEAYSFEKVLQRGFAVVRDETGALVSTPEGLRPGTSLDIQFKNDAHIKAVTASGGHTTRREEKKSETAETGKDVQEQTTLF
ncbi:MAG: exodeoxyribonuclease VII large subunit [Alphaproteobacteria bacterium]|nr:exodeoxyribonuclease VII large subunit [Alphaproteobacteria bacterium]